MPPKGEACNTPKDPGPLDADIYAALLNLVSDDMTVELLSGMIEDENWW
jgi:hypothetical protein